VDGAEQGTKSRLIVFVAVALSLVLSAFGAAASLPDAGEERAEALVEQMVRLAGLESDARARIPVRVNQEGGPLWVGEAVTRAVEEHPAVRLAEDGLGIVRVEVVADPTHVAMRGGLFRQGWNLRSEHPLCMRCVPWAMMVALGLGLGAMVVTRRMGLGLAVAGVAAQLIERLVSWPEGFVAIPWSDQVKDGPLGRAVVDLALALPEGGVALGAGIVTLCAVLMVFDHRRSSGRGGAMLAATVIGIAGVLMWAEAAARCGVGAWIGSPAGAASILSMALAWGQQARTLRRA